MGDLVKTGLKGHIAKHLLTVFLLTIAFLAPADEILSQILHPRQSFKVF